LYNKYMEKVQLNVVINADWRKRLEDIAYERSRRTGVPTVVADLVREAMRFVYGLKNEENQDAQEVIHDTLESYTLAIDKAKSQGYFCLGADEIGRCSVGMLCISTVDDMHVHHLYPLTNGDSSPVKIIEYDDFLSWVQVFQQLKDTYHSILRAQDPKCLREGFLDADMRIWHKIKLNLVPTTGVLRAAYEAMSFVVPFGLPDGSEITKTKDRLAQEKNNEIPDMG
jgi:hypothetical protein